MDSMYQAASDTKAFSQGARNTGLALEAATPAGRPHILMADDDPSIRELVAEYLVNNDLRVTMVPDAAAMRGVLGKEVIDLVLLGLKLGAENEMELARRLHEESAIPIVMLSGRNEEADCVTALELGVDDYLTKPFSLRELLARVRAILRRRRLEMRQGRVERVRAYRFGRWELNVNTRVLWSADARRPPLGNKDFSVLVAMLGAGARVLSRAELLDLSRSHDDEVYDRAVDVQIMRLRRMLEDDCRNPRYIVTVRGEGYRLGIPVESVY
jgi:DNA-binding response OmpR family regulator